MEAEMVIKDLNSKKWSRKEPTTIVTPKPKKKEVVKVQTKSAPQPPKKAESRTTSKRLELSDAFKEQVEKKYPFDEDVDEIFGALVANGKLTLLDPKRPGDVSKTNDPCYCPYHQMIPHPLNQCFVVRERINEIWRKWSHHLRQKLWVCLRPHGIMWTNIRVTKEEDHYFLQGDKNNSNVLRAGSLPNTRQATYIGASRSPGRWSPWRGGDLLYHFTRENKRVPSQDFKGGKKIHS